MQVFLYIDPGTGSMLFTILIGVISAGIYALRGAIIKLRFRLSGGKQTDTSSDNLPFVIFTDSKRYWNTFESVCDEFEARGEHMTYMTASPDDPALEKEYKHVDCKFIGEGNMAFAKLNMLHADVVLSTTPSLDVFQWKRSKNVKFYAHILHATTDPVAYRMFGIDYYDAILLSGAYQEPQIRELEEKHGVAQKELPMIGLPYMDAMKKRLDEVGPAPEHETTILLAPSWGPSAIFKRYGSKILELLLATGYHIIVRPHPQSLTSEKDMIDEIMAAFPANNQLEWNRDNDNFDVLRRSDVLISDFSGVIFDFSLVFDKPIIYVDTNYDKSPYDCCWLDSELWMFEALSHIGLQLTPDNLENIKNLIDTCMTDPRFADGRDWAREQSWQNRGESAKLTADYLIQKRKELIANATK